MSLLTGIASNVIIGIIEKVLTRSDIPVQNSNAPNIAEQVAKELEPVIANKMNAEPWYQSRVVIGSFVAILGGVLQLSGHTVAYEDQQLLVDLIGQGVTFVGAAYALYGRLKPNLKPLGGK